LTISANGWEDLLLDRCRSELDALEYAWVEDIDTSINAVAHEFNWLFDEPIDTGWVVWLVDNDTVFRGLLHLCHNNGSLITMLLVESCQISEWVVADDV
jgi:hypothetical protein